MRRRQNLDDTLKPISNNCTYPMSAFMLATGWGRHALKHARQKGLRVVKVAGRCFIRGKDFSDFLGGIIESEDIDDDESDDAENS